MRAFEIEIRKTILPWMSKQLSANQSAIEGSLPDFFRSEAPLFSFIPFFCSKVTVHHNQITAWNRKIAKMIYEYCDVALPVDFKGEKRYWAVVFDGNPMIKMDIMTGSFARTW